MAARGNIFSLLEATDSLVLEGWLWKTRRESNYYQKRWFTNSGDVYTLSYFISRTARTRKGFIDLRSAFALRTDEADHACTFQLCTLDREWVLQARGDDAVSFKRLLGSMVQSNAFVPELQSMSPTKEAELARSLASAMAGKDALFTWGHARPSEDPDVPPCQPPLQIGVRPRAQTSLLEARKAALEQYDRDHRDSIQKLDEAALPPPPEKMLFSHPKATRLSMTIPPLPKTPVLPEMDAEQQAEGMKDSSGSEGLAEELSPASCVAPSHSRSASSPLSSPGRESSPRLPIPRAALKTASVNRMSAMIEADVVVDSPPDRPSPPQHHCPVGLTSPGTSPKSSLGLQYKAAVASHKGPLPQRPAAATMSSGSGSSMKQTPLPQRPPSATATSSPQVIRLMKSEREYTAALKQIITGWLEPLKRNTELYATVLKSDMETMFCGIETLVSHHEWLTARLNVTASSSPFDKEPLLLFSRALLEREGPITKTYRDYLYLFPRAMDTLRKWMHSRSVRTFLRACQEQAGSTSDLGTLLTMPLDRVAEYDLQYERIILDPDVDPISGKATTKPKAKFEDEVELLMAHDIVHDLAEFAGERRTSYELSRVQEVFKDSNEMILNKIFLRSGPLQVTVPTMRLPRATYTVWLFADMVYCTKRAFTQHKVVFKVETGLIADVFTPKTAPLTLELSMEPDTVENVQFSCPTPEDRAAWANVFAYASHRSRDTRLFGVPLSQLMQRKSESSFSVPRFLTQATNALLAAKERLLRCEPPPRVAQVPDFAMVKETLNRGQQVEWAVVPPHIISETLRYWLRKLPEPVVPFHLYHPFVTATEPKELKNVVQQLPQYNQFVLQHVVEFLVSLSVPDRASLSDFVSVYAPCLLRTRDTLRNPQFSRYSAKDNELAAPGVIKRVIDNYAVVLKDVKTAKLAFEGDISARESDRQAKSSELRAAIAAAARVPGAAAQSCDPLDVLNSPTQLEFETRQERARTAAIPIGDIRKQGMLVKQGGMRKSWKLRWFVLTKGKLYYFKSPRDKRPKGEMELVRRCVWTNPLRPMMFSLSGEAGVRVLHMVASTEQERDEWVRAITMCIESPVLPPSPEAVAEGL
eukprot:m51a1_g1291 putative domain-containing protein (1098) ;mRNA; r:174576-178647